MTTAPRSALLALSLLFGPPAWSAETVPSETRERMMKSLAKDLGPSGAIELKTLEIRAKIYEPQVIYVLDRARIDVNVKDTPIKFAPRIEEPVLENRL